ncbi:solute carrier family 22 member 8-like [Argonauta hians]
MTYNQCSIDIIDTDGTVEPVNRTLDCVNGYHYTTPREKSIVSQWNLVCDKKGLAESTQTLYILGQVISGLVSPYLIENFGRKPVRVSSNFLLLLFNIIPAILPFYWLFATMRFLIGIVREAYVISTVALVCELYPKDQRITMSGLFMFIWNINYMAVALAAYILKGYSWHIFFWFNAVLSGYFLIDLFFLEESIRWLFANSKLRSAKKIVKKAARQNRIDFDNVWQLTSKDSPKPEASKPASETVETRRDSVASLPYMVEDKDQEDTSTFVKLVAIFKSSYLRKITVVISLEWAINTALANSIVLMLDVVGGSIYINFAILYSAATMSVSFYSMLAKRFGHKLSLQTLKMFAAICVVSAALIKAFAGGSLVRDTVIPALYIMTAASLNAACCGDYIYTSELYPTQIRSVGSGVATVVMRIVCMGAPFFKVLALAVPWSPAVIIATGAVVTSLMLQLFLPETGNQVLPQTIEDIETLQRQHNNKEKKHGDVPA